jgi:hypothetical protein
VKEHAGTRNDSVKDELAFTPKRRARVFERKPSPGSQTASSNTWERRTNQADPRVLVCESEQQASMCRQPEGSLAKDQDSGMETGLAKKLGNADGVKVSTAMNRETRNIPHISKMEKERQAIQHE